MRIRARSPLVTLVAAVALFAIAAAAPGAAKAAPWCGTIATEDRSAAVTGRQIHVIYAIPSDGEDRSAQFAPQISGWVDEITAWWQAQDSGRVPRFDLAVFPCGLQVDLTVLRLQASSVALAPIGDRFDQIANEVVSAGGGSPYTKYLVFFDGPSEEPDLCGQGGGSPDEVGVAVVYERACDGVPKQATAAHELIHAFGALPQGDVPHRCPDSPGHPCDSESDILYPFAGGNPLGTLVLDSGRDDYYGHSGSWFDVQDSGWLRRLGPVFRLSLAIAGPGNVTSLVPGVDCTTSCETDWEAGSIVDLEATPDPGQRLIRWTGACSGTGECSVPLDAAKSVGAVFAKLAYRLTVSVKGRGSVAIGSSGFVPCRSRCSSSQTSYRTLALKAKADKGWKLVRWTGVCRGKAAVCRVPMSADTSVGAVFSRR
ncbi:MAG: hypothetical protein U0R50_08885 [Gaiellales bacterium]